MTQEKQLHDDRVAETIVDDAYIRRLYGFSRSTSHRLRTRKHNPLPHFYIGSLVRYRLAEVKTFFEGEAVKA